MGYEIYWAQHAHENWIMGDRNTKFFQVGATIRKKTKLYLKLWMNTEFGRKTKVLFCRPFHRKFIDVLRRIQIIMYIWQLLYRDISDEDNSCLTQEITMEEVWRAVKQTGPLKALDPDSMHVCFFFYQKCWNITSYSALNMIKSFLHHCHLLKELNDTNITLTP